MAEYYGNICTCRKCNGIVHTIRKGDTLYLLSRYYNVTINEIMRANANVNVYNLQIGDQICIPVRRPAPTPMPMPPSNRPGQNMNPQKPPQGIPGGPQRPMMPQPREDENNNRLNEIEDLIEDIIDDNNQQRVQSERMMESNSDVESFQVNAQPMNEHMPDSYEAQTPCCGGRKVKDVLKDDDMTLEDLARMLKNM